MLDQPLEDIDPDEKRAYDIRAAAGAVAQLKSDCRGLDTLKDVAYENIEVLRAKIARTKARLARQEEALFQAGETAAILVNDWLKARQTLATAEKYLRELRDDPGPSCGPEEGV